MILVIATRNLHKVEEIRTILGPDLTYETLRDFPKAPAVIEDAGSFVGNATKKAIELACWLSGCLSDVQTGTGDPEPARFVLADDSGLEVDALGGAPGVHSARFAALDTSHPGNSADVDNNTKLLRLLKDVPLERRTARFRCVLALTPVLAPGVQTASPTCSANELELHTRVFEGTCEGRIGFAPKGNGGFGYDPLFLPNGFQESFAELGETIKNGLSHRAKALACLLPALRA